MSACGHLDWLHTCRVVNPFGHLRTCLKNMWTWRHKQNTLQCFLCVQCSVQIEHYAEKMADYESEPWTRLASSSSTANICVELGDGYIRWLKYLQYFNIWVRRRIYPVARLNAQNWRKLDLNWISQGGLKDIAGLCHSWNNLHKLCWAQLLSVHF